MSEGETTHFQGAFSFSISPMNKRGGRGRLEKVGRSKLRLLKRTVGESERGELETAEFEARFVFSPFFLKPIKNLWR